MTRFKSNGGFTLIELLVVIAVLGILAAVAIPRLTGVTDRAQMSEYISAAGQIRSGMEMYYAENANEYPSDFSNNSNNWDDMNDTLDYIDLPDELGDAISDFSYEVYEVNEADYEYKITFTVDHVTTDNMVTITESDVETSTTS